MVRSASLTTSTGAGLAMPTAACEVDDTVPILQKGSIKTHTHAHRNFQIYRSRENCVLNTHVPVSQLGHSAADGLSHGVCTPRTSHQALVGHTLAVASVPG